MQKPAFLRKTGSSLKWGGAASRKPENFPQPQVSKNIEPFPKKLYEDPAFLQQKYVIERLSIKEISRLTFSSRWAVRTGLKRAGIELRNQRQQGKTKSQLGFGQMMRKGRLVKHRRELAAAQKMQMLRKLGWSYWKIADVMNAWGIKTKTGRGRWQARTVQQILDRILD